MTFTRRQLLGHSASIAGLAAVGFPIEPALASAEGVQKLMTEFSGGKIPETGRITLTVPDIAENGSAVPVSVAVDSAMDGEDLVESVALYADGNPNPAVATFYFTALSGAAVVTTRIRLAKTQNVVAIAKMKDGSVFMDSREVQVSIGGCSG